MSNQQRSFFFNVDWLLVLIYLALCTIGVLCIHSAVFDPKNPNWFDLDTNYGKQLVFVIVAITLAIFILLLESRFLSALAPAMYVVTTILLLLVLVVGRNVGGNQAWIPLPGGFRLQPSEFAKFSTCLLLARYLSATNVKITELRSFATAAAIIFVPMLLILLQPDAGSTLVFSSLLFVLYREGLSPYFLILEGLFIALFVITIKFGNLPFIIGAIVLVAIAIILLFKRNRKLMVTMGIGAGILIAFVLSVQFLYTKVLKPHQKVRIDIVLGITNDPRGKGYNVNQSKIAIGSGKLWGKGYMHGTQTKYSFVPEQSTDFIFCTVGEEFGFAGSVVVLSLYLLLVLRIIHIAERQRSPFSRIYAYGVASIIFFHVVINVGMTIGIVPSIGIPLPLISYGGSSLISFTIMLFILIKLDSNRMGMIYA
ncbi:rod shape-determining protein RodA [Mucilaginibacter ximonensis]|uniref:Rod shape-determining protein RodA n=1 Tax=Mucilaginibacter ximonensis TaxID=538021 RepID=A0ABW5YER2_9SPHI